MESSTLVGALLTQRGMLLWGVISGDPRRADHGSL